MHSRTTRKILFFNAIFLFQPKVNLDLVEGTVHKIFIGKRCDQASFSYTWNGDLSQGKQSRVLHAKECLPGYHGPLCNMTCRFPNYGEECQLQCLCKEEQCDHTTGCDGKKCLPGYHGTLCNMICRYPNYGYDCQQGCLCEEDSCNHVTGCLQTNESDWNQRLPFNTGWKIMYVSVENISLGTKPPFIGSMWSKINMTHRAMFISTCIIGTIVFVFMFIVFIYGIHKRKDAVVRYYRLRKRKKSKKISFHDF